MGGSDTFSHYPSLPALFLVVVVTGSVVVVIINKKMIVNYMNIKPSGSDGSDGSDGSVVFDFQDRSALTKS
ncbi:TPA: hypothetical protein G8N93_000424 [Salmonella enterica]|nr:hypothetical protein [Salmonella enterica]